MRDSEVVASIVAGDPDGLATAYDRYAAPLFKYCRTLLSDPADAADAVQDTFVIAASRLDGLRDPARFRAWLYSVARNESLRILRSKKGTSAYHEAPDVTDDSGDVSEHAERAQLKTLFEEAAAGLNPTEREVIELQLRQGLEAAEVADVLGFSRNHAYSLLSRARDQLESCLAVLLVGRAGRDECRELGSMLSGWDGRLTVLLRKRVHRHIEHCATCTARRAIELRPAMLLGLSPGAALAAGAAASLKFAASTPMGLRGTRWRSPPDTARSRRRTRRPCWPGPGRSAPAASPSRCTPARRAWPGSTLRAPCGHCAPPRTGRRQWPPPWSRPPSRRPCSR